MDILALTEAKLNYYFLNMQFLVDGFSEPFRIDRNRSGGGAMIYVRKNIPSKLLTKPFFPNYIEGLFVELSFRKCKWLLLQPSTKYLRLTLVFMWNGALQEKFNIFFFKSFSLVLAKLWFWQEDWALGYHFMKFWDFLDIS